MRVLIFSITFKPFIGGAEIALDEILKRLPHIKASIITARLDATLPIREEYNNITIYRVGKGKKLDKYFYIFRAYKLAQRLHKKEPFHIAQALMANYAGIAALFFKYRNPQVPYLLTLQSGDSPFFIWIRTVWFLPFYKRVYRKADFIQAISIYLMDRAKRYGYKGKGEVIPNGVAFELFSLSKSEHEIDALRNTLGIEPSDRVVITTSRLVYKNAVDQLILGFNEWQSKTKTRAKLLIVGNGKDEAKLKKLVRVLSIEKRVIFCGEKLYNELPLYLQSSDLFVRASRSEGMGNSFIEALAAGIPIIGTHVGGIADFLKNRETGLVVDKDNPYAIARAIDELIHNDELVSTIVKNGKALIGKRYDWNVIAKQMDTVYRALAKV